MRVIIKPGSDTGKTFMLALIVCLMWGLFAQWGYYSEKIRDNEKRIMELESIIIRNTTQMDKTDRIIEVHLNVLDNITRRR